MPFPFTFPFAFDAHSVLSADAGSGVEATLAVMLNQSDGGSGFDALKAMIGASGSGSDMRLHGGAGQAKIPSKGVNI